MTVRWKKNLSVLIFLAISLLWFVFIFIPLWKKIRTSSQKLILLNAQLTSFQEEISVVKDFERQYSQRKDVLEKLNNSFIDFSSPVKFISFLEEKAADNSLFLEIHPSSPGKARGDPWPSMSFQLNIFGSFPHLFRFLKSLEFSHYLIGFDSLGIRVLGKDDGALKQYKGLKPGEIAASLHIRAFSQSSFPSP